MCCLCVAQNKTVGIIGAGRIGVAYAKMMIEGHKMDCVYFDPYPNTKFEEYVKAYGDFLESVGDPRVTCTRMATVEDVLRQADVSFGSLCSSMGTQITFGTKYNVQ